MNKDNFLGTGGRLVLAYADLMKSIWMDTTRSVVEPSSFKRSLSKFAPQFAGFQQHDAQEFLAYLLDGIHEDLNRVKKKPYIEDKDCDGTNDEQDAIEAWKNYLQRNRSLIVDLFQGQLRNTCTCRVCNHRNIRFEPFMFLSLPISDRCRSVQDCLELFLHTEDLTGDNQWYCGKCKTHVDATKKIDLWILPPILIIHLKRFRYDEFGRAGRKTETALHCPMQQWDLSKTVRSKGGDSPIYDLYAVANHFGGLGGGHYTAYALNRFDDQWYEFNDSRYQVIQDPERRFGTSASPYVLFFNRSEGFEDDTSGRSIPLIRRQSVSRPELWPHSQVREGQFRGFRRASTRSVSIDIGSNGVETTAEEGQEETTTNSGGEADDDRPEVNKKRAPADESLENGADRSTRTKVDGVDSPAIAS